jgi:hypothetical protein
VKIRGIGDARGGTDGDNGSDQEMPRFFPHLTLGLSDTDGWGFRYRGLLPLLVFVPAQ